MRNHELNTAIGEALRAKFAEAGIEGCPEPRVLWRVGKDDLWKFSGNEWQCRDWLERMQREYPGYVAGMEVYHLEKWPNFCDSGDAMVQLIEAMRLLGWWTTIDTESITPEYSCWMARQGDSDGIRTCTATIPLAVARAAVAALKIENK